MLRSSFSYPLSVSCYRQLDRLDLLLPSLGALQLPYHQLPIAAATSDGSNRGFREAGHRLQDGADGQRAYIKWHERLAGSSRPKCRNWKRIPVVTNNSSFRSLI